MAFDEKLAQRIRKIVAGRTGIVEKRMFGGLAFLLDGHMFCGPTGTDLMIRVGPEAYADALSAPHAREMDFTGRPLEGYVYVAAAGVESDDDLRAWIERGLSFVRGLPAKKPAAKKAALPR